ncbi:MAG: hypothetical protein JWM86_1196 [Thermoleophilia bacterium]|nr:hypothetical protein [Thermoleophilia bacterium]
MPRGRSLDGVISELASRTCSVVHIAALRDAGVTRDSVARRVREGWMAPILPGTYGVGPLCRTPTVQMQCMAALLAGGHGAVLDGQTSAALQGVWDRGDDSIHVTVPGRSLRDAPPPFVVHHPRPGWQANSPRIVGQLAVSGFVDMCVCLSRFLTKWQLASVIVESTYHRVGCVEELEVALPALMRVPGSATIRGAIALVRSGSAGTRGPLEDEVLNRLLELGVPEPLVNVRGALGLSRDEPDLVWPEHRLNVELDGRHHEELGQAADDAKRDAEARALGWIVLRIRARDFYRAPSATLRRICSALACTGRLEARLSG